MSLYLNCSLCEKPMEIKKNKKGKPYCLCSECQSWLFVNGDSGIKRLKAKAQDKGSKSGHEEKWF
jgi:hypothetical protein